MNYWLFKTEPGSYSIEDLERDGETFWDGVRNYQARNMLRDDIKPGDTVFVYHSNARPPAIVGLAEVAEGGSVDPTAFEQGAHYFDAKSNPESPRWFGVRIAFKRRFREPLGLPQLREMPGLENMLLLRRGMRLSIQPVTANEARLLLKRLG